jgi:hypothetical protein
VEIFLRVASVVWCMTISRRGDPSQKRAGRSVLWS